MSKTSKNWLNTKPHTAEHARRNIFLGLAAASITYFLVNPYFADLAKKFYGTGNMPAVAASPTPVVSAEPSPLASVTPVINTPTPKPRVSPKPVAPKISPVPVSSPIVKPSPVIQRQEEADPMVECHNQPECGGGSQIIRESECNRTGCCPIAPGKYETTTEDQCKQKQIDYANQYGNPW